ncbi:MAG: hypothetical protein K6A63_06790, partial [Acholeplasmatales bacterium]|nr:hypothetical protein [Acholeplasmatales bacterium]
MRKIINGLLSIGIFLAVIIFLASCGGGGKKNSVTTSTRYIDSARTIKVVQIDGTATVSDESDT